MFLVYLIISILLSAAALFNRKQSLNKVLVFAYMLLLIAFTVLAYLNKGSVWNQFFTIDGLGLIFSLVMTIIVPISLYHSFSYFKHRSSDKQRIRAQYLAAFFMFVTSINAVFFSNHFGVTWIFIELTTLTAGIIIYHHRSSRALEAAWKYIFVCTLSITLVFIGLLFLAIASHEAGVESLHFDAIRLKASAFNPFWLQAAYLFILTGFSAKASLVPMYTAGIDAKDKAPSPFAALLSASLVNAGFIGIFRMYEIMAQTELFTWARHVNMICALSSVIVATSYMLRVRSLKRLLAYSTVEHAGISLLALSIPGVGYTAAILHMILHSLIKSAVFFQAGQISKTYDSVHLEETGGYFKYNTAGALIMLFGIISLAAMPPSGLFISEFLTFKALFSSGNYFIIGLLALVLAFALYGMAWSILKLLFTKPSLVNAAPVEASWSEMGMQSFLLITAVYLAYVLPDWFTDLINEAIFHLPV